METVAVTGNLRTKIGKKETKAVRAAKEVPCVIYGGNEVVHFSAKVKEFKKLIYTPDFKVAEINVDSKKYKCFIKSTQFHPVTDDLLHIDFMELLDDRKMIVEIPVRFKGTSPGVKEGGALNQKVRRVKIKTTADKLVDELFVDISELKLGFSVRVRDIELPEGIEIMNASGIPVASVEVPRALRSAAAAAEGEEGAEGAEAAE